MDERKYRRQNAWAGKIPTKNAKLNFAQLEKVQDEKYLHKKCEDENLKNVCKNWKITMFSLCLFTVSSTEIFRLLTKSSQDDNINLPEEKCHSTILTICVIQK